MTDRDEHEQRFWTDADRSLSRTVTQEDDAPVKSGLLDAAGRPLVRLQERGPLGFHIPGVRP